MSPLLLIAALWAGVAAAEEPVGVRNRFSTGLWFDAAPSSNRYGLELLLSDTLSATLVSRANLRVDLFAAGRLGVRLLEGGRVDRVRVRSLAVRVAAGRVTFDLGRFTPPGGGYRLVDGVQVLGDVGHGVRVGAWGGFGADPWSTAPALRMGGGPILTWDSDRGGLTLLGEVLATPDGLDRVSGVAYGRVELGRVAELSGLVDLQAGEADNPVRVSDATAFVRIDPHDEVRLDLLYDAWSSLSYLVSAGRDPLVTRFAARSRALADDPWIPQDVLDPSVYHMVGTTLTWTRGVQEDGPMHVVLAAAARYRHHEEADRRHARAGLDLRLVGLAGGRVDVGVGERFLWWLGQPGSDTRLSLWAQLDKQGRVALDMSGEAVVQPLPGSDLWAPAFYADLFLDVFATPTFSVAAGYAFGNALDFDRWDTSHGALVQLSWRADSRGLARRDADRSEP